MFDKRFRKTVRTRKMIKKGDLVAVGLSGGKDSTVLLHSLARLRKDLPFELVAITIDEGIAGYRARTMKPAKASCEKLSIEQHVFSFKELCGKRLDHLVRKSEENIPCSQCGVLRRYALNKAARELKAHRLALGHNLDDMAQTNVLDPVAHPLGTVTVPLDGLSQATFDPPWDYVSIWGIVEGVTYPYLQANAPPFVPGVPLRINSDADFDEAHGVVNWATGDGSQGNPWIIEGLDIDGTGFGYCIYIGNTTDHFIVKDSNLRGASGVSSWPYFLDTAVTLINVGNCTLYNNTISNNVIYGILLVDSDDNVIDGNEITSNLYGVVFSSCHRNLIYNNTIAQNDQVGIAIDDGIGNNVLSNTISDQTWVHGIWLNNTQYTNITDNIIADNGPVGYGIACSYSISNNITRNNIINNNGPPLGFDTFCFANRIFHNNFINNTQNTPDDATLGLNQYSDEYPSGGNYWSQYVGTDVMHGESQTIDGSDGIGDTWLDIGPANRDSYPLMSPFEYVEYELPLTMGWALFSIPVRQLNWSSQEVFADTVGGGDAIYTYNTTDTTWWTDINWRPASLNDPMDVNHLRGYWGHIVVPGTTVTIKGDLFNSTLSIPLHAGWNMIGYPTMTSVDIATALAGTGYDLPVEGFNATHPYRISPLADTYMMQPGEGYWVHVPADTIWTVDW